MNILELIPQGHENAVGRDYLSTIYANHFGMSKNAADRKMRRDIEFATNKGSLIFHCEQGYFQYKDENDLPYCNIYYRSETSKGWSIINKNRKIKKFLDSKQNGIQTDDGQINLFEMMGGG